MLIIRRNKTSDSNEIWAIMEPIIRGGETYTLPCDMCKQDALDYWIGPNKQTYVAVEQGKILGTYKLMPNQLGPGAHVANGSYMTHENARGKGIARAMCAHSLIEAKTIGYAAIQFNFVVANNVAAIGLWTSMGFKTIGRLPAVFDHPKDGFVDALVMFKMLK